MTLRDSLLPALATVRSIPGLLGLRESRAYLRTATWSGSLPGVGTRTTADVEILEDGQPPRIEQATTDDVQSFGDVVLGGITIGPLTPGGPVDQEDIEAALAAGKTRHIRVTGGRWRTAGQMFRIVGLQRGPLTIRIACQPDA